jgi:nucleoside-diphosphate-sugar epimerase
MPYDLEVEDYIEDVMLQSGPKNCLVTGGAGFIGSNIVNKLINEGHFVRVVDDLSSGSQYNLNPRAEFYKIDIAEHPFLDMFQDIDIVFHLAAFPRVEPSIEDPIRAHRINVNGTLNILKACSDYGVKRVVFTSSSAVYGEAETPTTENNTTNPMSPYALNKLIGEQYCKLFSDIYKLQTVCLRYSNAYGDNQPTEGPYCNVMGIFKQQKMESKPMTIVGDGEQRRDFIHVDDIADANLQVAFTDKISFLGDVFNIGYGKNYSVNEIANWMGGKTEYIEPRIEPRETLLNSDKFKNIFDWKPTIDLKDWLENKND